MKKLKLSLLVCILTGGIHSQIKVDNNNRVAIGGLTTDANFKLTIRMDAGTYSGLCVDAAVVPDWGTSTITKVVNPYATSYKVQYNGTDKFYVRGDGYAWAYSGWLTGSDQRIKVNVINLQNALSKIMKMQGVYYNLKETNTVSNSNKNEVAKIEEKRKIGFIAQDLEKILPEVVHEDGNGLKGIAYQEMVALLVEGVKEQQAKISELESKLKLLQNQLEGDKAKGVSGDQIQPNPILFQNAPNPFSIETKIKYFIPSISNSANIFVYDSNGNKKKSVSLLEKGEGVISIAAKELGQGIYFYSLVVDGKIYDSKTMLITE